MKTTKLYKIRIKLLKWAINRFIRVLDDKDLYITKAIITDIEYSTARKGWNKFKEISNRNKSLSEVLSKENFSEYRTMIVYKKD